MDGIDVFREKAMQIADLNEADYHSFIDQFEKAMVDNLAPGITTREDEFFDIPGGGIYRRTLFMPAGSLVTSKKHRMHHPFCIMTGAAYVISQGHAELIRAPYKGSTVPGTRRLILVVVDCVWTADYPNPDNTHDLELLESRIIDKHENPLLLDSCTPQIPQ